MARSHITAGQGSARVIEPLSSSTSSNLIHLQQALGALFGIVQPGRNPKTGDCHSNEEFWSHVLREDHRYWSGINLRGFRVFEWVPRAPGLYHTSEARRQREMAGQFIMELPVSPDHFLEATESAPDHAEQFRNATSGWEADRTVVFDPRGKASMIRGGIGCIRLKPVVSASGEQFWLMGASSAQGADEGIPILVSDDHYGALITEIKEHGYAGCRDISGKLRFVPPELAQLYNTPVGVPQVYLQAESVKSRAPRSAYFDRGYVSVAASFLSNYERQKRLYATYVTFDPGWPGARASATQWLENDYVTELYQGEVVTDFDQQAPKSGALFSLDDVLNGAEVGVALDGLKRVLGKADLASLRSGRIVMNHMEKTYMTNNTTSGNNSPIVTSHGSGTASASVVNNQSAIDSKSLVEELVRIRDALEVAPVTETNSIAKGRVIEAKVLAESGDQQAAAAKLKDKSTIGDTILKVATSVSASVIEKLITGGLEGLVG